MRQRLAALLILALAACGGGGGGGGSIVPSKTAAGSGSLAVTLRVPAKTAQARAHQQRSLTPLYESPATQGLGISIAAAPATPSPVSSPTVAFDLSSCSASNNCTQNADGSRSYTVSTPSVPVGTYNVVIATWDQPPTNGGFPRAPAARRPALVVYPTELSDAAATVTIGSLNTPFNVTLNGIPLSVSAIPISGQTHVITDTVNSGYKLVGNVATDWSVVGLDADGYIIAGDGAPLFTFSDSTNSLTVASTSQPNIFTIAAVKAQPQPISLSIDAKGLGPSGVSAVTANLGLWPAQELWQTSSGYIYGYMMDPYNNYAPVSTGGCGPCGFGGNPTDIVQTTTSPQAIAQDSSGKVWTFDTGANGGAGALVQYAQTSYGPPNATGVTIATTGKVIAGLVGDNNGFLYGVDQSANALDVWKVVGGTPAFVTSVTLKNSSGFGVGVIPSTSTAPASLLNDVLVATSGGVEFYTNASAGTPVYVATLAAQSGASSAQAVAVTPDDGAVFILDTNPTLGAYTLKDGPSMTLQQTYSGGTRDDDLGYLSAGIADLAATSDGTDGYNDNLYQWIPGTGINGMFQFQTPNSANPWGVLITP